MNLLAFAASSSKKSINKQLVTYAAGLVDNANVEVLDLNDYELPLFSEDKELEIGQPSLAQAFLSKIAASDALTRLPIKIYLTGLHVLILKCFRASRW
jgi:chromate reductase